MTRDATTPTPTEAGLIPAGLPAASTPVYGISVTAELSGIAVQTLRLYEQRGLLAPARTQGGTRRYSTLDLQRLGRIDALAADGITIVAIARILDLEDRNTALTEENTRLKDIAKTRRRTTKENRRLTDD